MITNENWIDFCSAFFGVENKKWLEHVTTNWNTMTNRSGCGCEFWKKCEHWLEMNPPKPVEEAEVPTYAGLEIPQVNLEDFAYHGPILDDEPEYIDIDLPREIESK